MNCSIVYCLSHLQAEPNINNNNNNNNRSTSNKLESFWVHVIIGLGFCMKIKGLKKPKEKKVCICYWKNEAQKLD
jgi:hypothetical protein